MKKIIYSLAFVSVLLAMSSCTKDFNDINTPTTAVTKINPAYLFVSLVDNGVYADYQRNVNLFDDFYSQYFANSVNGFQSDRYLYNDGWVGNLWKEFYTQRLTEYTKIVATCNTNPTVYSNETAMADIYMCYLWSRMTDKYGDIPYFKAGSGDVSTYDPQSKIYPDLLKRLTDDVAKLKDDANQSGYGSYDLLYKGDVSKWKKFGNSLRLRLAMRMSEVDSKTAQNEVKAAIEAGVMESNSDVAKVAMDASGWYDYLQQMAVNWDNIRISKTFTNYLNNQVAGTVDPRAQLWLRPVTGQTNYDGLQNGWDIIPDGWQKLSTIRVSDGSYKDFLPSSMACPVMFYSEVCFLKAEAALRGWIAGDANALYQEGVRASMDYVGVDAATANNYISKLPTISSMNDFGQLITQKWIANFPNGVEAWAENRRTDYPILMPLASGISANATVASGQTVKRIRYPDNEHRLNEASMPANLNTLAKDRMDVKVWWDVK